MKVYHPIPTEIDKLIGDPKVLLSTFDRFMCGPDAQGQTFHAYSMKIVKRLMAAGVKTFIDLQNEYRKVNSKSSNLSKSLREMVLGHYTYYGNEMKKEVDFWNSLTEEQRATAVDGYYVEEVENPNGMKLSLVEINQSLNESGEALVKKESLVSDMNVIHEHYMNNEVPDQLKDSIDNYDPIKLGKNYLSMLLGRQLELTEEGDNIRFSLVQ